jgi:molybdopterin converting factor small subunit
VSVVRIPPTLRAETGGEREVLAEGATVRELLDDLMARFPSLREQIVEDDGLAPFVNVYVDGEDVRTRDGLDTAVDESDTVILLPAMAGGEGEHWSLSHASPARARGLAPDKARRAVSGENPQRRG